MDTSKMTALDHVRCMAYLLHSNQKRKFSELPYSIHLQEVADLVEEFNGSEEQIAAAYCHDIVENTHIKVIPLTSFFSKYGFNEAGGLVEELTDKYTKEKYAILNRYERKLLEHDRLSKISDKAKLIKLADVISNVQTLDKCADGFAKLMLTEMHHLIPLIKIDNPIYAKATNEFNSMCTVVGSRLNLF